jgi:hypothetical protein
MDFEEHSFLKCVPKVLEKMIFDTELSAKAIILSKKDLDTEIRDAVLQMDSHTLEAIGIYVLSLLFREDRKSLFVRAATFIDRLSQCIEFHITVIVQRKQHALGMSKENGSVKGMTKSPAQGAKRKQKDKKVSVKDESTSRTIAIYLMEFLIDRKILNVSEDFIEAEVSNRRGRYTKLKFLYVMCLFDISTLPVKNTLPMIVPPVDWRVKETFQRIKKD